MINISPVGRNASSDERNAYEKYDIEHKIRETFIQEIEKRFPDIGLTYSIGIIPFDIWRLM
jgi:phosphomannomutase